MGGRADRLNPTHLIRRRTALAPCGQAGRGLAGALLGPAGRRDARVEPTLGAAPAHAEQCRDDRSRARVASSRRSGDRLRRRREASCAPRDGAGRAQQVTARKRAVTAKGPTGSAWPGESMLRGEVDPAGTLADAAASASGTNVYHDGDEAGASAIVRRAGGDAERRLRRRRDRAEPLRDAPRQDRAAARAPARERRPQATSRLLRPRHRQRQSEQRRLAPRHGTSGAPPDSVRTESPRGKAGPECPPSSSSSAPS